MMDRGLRKKDRNEIAIVWVARLGRLKEPVC